MQTGMLELTQLEYPLTYPQQGVWSLEKISPNHGIGNIAATLKVNRIFEPRIMEESVNLLLAKNEAFRLRFFESETGQIVQTFAPFHPYQLEYFDFSQQDPTALFQWDKQESTRPFPSFNGDLYYFALVKIDADHCGIFAKVHHLLSDAWSLVKIANDLVAYYDLIVAGQTDQIAQNPSYRDFILAEQRYLESERYQLDRTFWLEQFSTPPVLASIKSPKTEHHAFEARRKSFTLPDKLAAKIRDYCQTQRTSIFALFFAALSIYVNRIKDQDDLTFGTPVLNRTHSREKNTIGMFISTVPLRIRVDQSKSFAEFSRQIDQLWFSVLKHQKYPYDHLLKDAREHHPDIEKLYEIGLSYQNAHFDQLEAGTTAQARWHFVGYQSETLLIHISDRETEQQLVLNFDYQTAVFSAREIDFIHDHLIRLLWHAIDNPERQLAQIHMLSEQEANKVIRQFNLTDAAYPNDQTIGELFARQADLHPNAAALSLGQRQVTYHELDQMAEAIARALRHAGVQRETLVGLLFKPSATMLAAILGVVKAGGAYLPIDPDYPPERIAYMLNDSQTQLVLVPNSSWQIADFTGRVLDAGSIAVQTLRAVRRGQSWPRQKLVNEPADLLYVIYTSGSTGRPKGAMIEHKNVVRLLFTDQNRFDFSAQDTWTLFHSYCFDFSVWEMYGALLNGGRLVIVPKVTARDPAAFLHLLERERVSILNQTPAAFYNLVDTLGRFLPLDLHLRMVIFGGDALKPTLLKPFHARFPKARLINMYGITETTVHVTFLELSDSDLDSHVSNVGRPIPTMRAYILDRRLNPLPIGIPGELCVSGEGVGRGYLNNPELTASRFVPNPFVPGEILYRSGDLARFFPRGDIEYLGRLDHQVKIRGHRIELGEIEAAILSFGGIREARVLTREHEQLGKQLIAYFVPLETLDLQELRQHLSQVLPDYMVPPYLMAIDEMPLNSNGKIDRKKLPEPTQMASRHDRYAIPQTPLQQMVAEVFSNVLGLKDIGLYDHFFHLGGDSLSAVQAVAYLGESVSFADLYAHPTVSGMAGFLARHELEGCSRGHLLHMNSVKGYKQLIAFPFAGGSAASFLKFSQAFEAQKIQISLSAVNRPPMQKDLRILAQELALEIDEGLDGELFFYSHCAGSALAIETARQLKTRGRDVQLLIIGASMPPGRLAINPWRVLKDSQILTLLRRLGLPQSAKNTVEQKLMDIMPSFRSDAADFFDYFKSLQSLPVQTLEAAKTIHCLAGSRDPLTWGSRIRYRGWRRFAKVVKLTVLPTANHYFLTDQAAELARLIKPLLKG